MSALDRIRSRIISSARVLRFELVCYAYSLIGICKSIIFFNKYANNKLEIGAGKSRKAGYITIDLDIHADYPFDLRLGLPFPSDSIETIYAEHVLEHFIYGDMIALLKECRRVLKKGGAISLSVPDIRIWVDAYTGARTNFDTRLYCEYDVGLRYDTAVNYLNFIFYMGGHHRHMFDSESICQALSDAGFSSCRLREFDQTIDQMERRHTSLYAEAKKE